MSKQPLDEYRAKRDFGRTAEPSGDGGPDHGAATPDGTVGRFVVQRHRARRLHYDLRLEIDGVLVSWAVPKGPTLDPAARHLAVHVEDHPLDYADFEGVIPAGEYGGGDVIVWDRGTWAPTRTTTTRCAAVEAGELHFDLFGEKLAGRFVLVRTDGRPAPRGGRSEWLLLHKRDELRGRRLGPGRAPQLGQERAHQRDVAAAPEALWRSDAPADEAEIATGWPPRPTWSRSPTPTDELEALDALGAKGDLGPRRAATCA